MLSEHLYMNSKHLFMYTLYIQEGIQLRILLKKKKEKK